MIIAMSWMGCQAEIFTLIFLHNEETSAQLEKIVAFDTETLFFITQESIKSSLKSWISLKCSTRKESLKSSLHTSQLEATIFFTIIHSKWNAEKNIELGREMSDNLEVSVVFLAHFSYYFLFNSLWTILSCHITLLEPRSFTHSANSDVTLPNYEVPFNPQHRSTCTWKCNYISIRCREAETLGYPRR